MVEEHIIICSSLYIEMAQRRPTRFEIQFVIESEIIFYPFFGIRTWS